MTPIPTKPPVASGSRSMSSRIPRDALAMRWDRLAARSAGAPAADRDSCRSTGRSRPPGRRCSRLVVRARPRGPPSARRTRDEASSATRGARDPARRAPTSARGARPRRSTADRRGPIASGPTGETTERGAGETSPRGRRTTPGRLGRAARGGRAPRRRRSRSDRPGAGGGTSPRSPRARPAHREARPAAGSGGSVTIFTKRPLCDSAWKGSAPVTISCKITPSDQTSVRASITLSARICSGDMYAGVPIDMPVAVIRCSSAVMTREIPKSSSFGTIAPVGPRARKMFSGFRSRWITFRSCAKATASIARDEGARAPPVTSHAPSQGVSRTRRGPALRGSLLDDERCAILGRTDVEDVDDVGVPNEVRGLRLPE